jgi:hypothetical protein
MFPPIYMEVGSGNFASNNHCKISTTETLWYEVGCDKADVLRTAFRWGSLQGHLPGAWDQPPHSEQLGEGDESATEAGRRYPPEVDAGQLGRNRLTSVFIVGWCRQDIKGAEGHSPAPTQFPNGYAGLPNP